jgi:predicted DNA-binding transcriptional regulator AlpA
LAGPAEKVRPMYYAEQPPLVCYRSALTNDPNGPISALPEWMPSGWESREYPAINDVEACRQWLENKRRYFAGIEEAHLQFMINGVELSVVRDTHRLVRHIQAQKGWPNEPIEPKEKYFSSNASIEVYQRIAAELARVRDWIEKSLVSARQHPTPRPEQLWDELVTLDQVAPLTGLSKRTLERYVRQGKLPTPDIPGGGGKANKWFWANLRSHIASLTHRALPERFPGSRLI